MLRGRGLFNVMCAALFVAACATAQPADEPAAEPEVDPLIPGQVESAQRTYLRVNNRNFNDMTVYVMRGSARYRLGLVSGVSSQTLLIPASIVGRGGVLQFQVDPIGGSRSPISESISVEPGETVELEIPSS